MTIEVRVATAGDMPAIATLRWAEDADGADGLDAFVRDFVAWVAAHPSHHCVAAFDSDSDSDSDSDGDGDGAGGGDSDGDGDGDGHGAGQSAGDRAVGMAWLAELPRVPGVENFDRAGGDVQTVFLLPEYRGRGIGTTMLNTITELASELGLGRVTVHSGTRAITLYKRAGFAVSDKQLVREADVVP